MLTYSKVLNDILIKLASGTSITAEEHRSVEQALLEFARDQWLTGDIKKINCTNQYRADNFDEYGMGTGERLGWHICNGLNNTRNRTGRVSVGYGKVQPYDPGNAKPYPSVGDEIETPVIDGSKDAIVVSHTHTFTKRNNQNDNFKKGSDVQKTEYTESVLTTGDANGGVSGTDKNMQPYIVTLFIQKL
jgi:hypothetical protein